MQMAQFIEALQEDLRELGLIGGEDLANAVDRLGKSVAQSARLRLIDALAQAALELSQQLPNGHVDVRVAGQDPELVFVEEAASETFTATGDGEHARITLRLPEPLKAAIESSAASEGVSVNTWLIRALSRAIHTGGWGLARTGKRITGYSQA